jgi:hypothetical protein
MFKNILAASVLGFGVLCLIGFVGREAFADRRQAEFYRVGKVGACEIYRLEDSPVYVASSSYANYSCSITR